MRSIALALVGLVVSAAEVRIQVGPAAEGPWRPIWNFFGYDEPNYTYMKDGRKLLSELAAIDRGRVVHVRVHNLLTSGDGEAALKWGSTNAYTEDAAGKPVYNWKIVDAIFDAKVERGMKPMVELGFMPQALSAKPEPYRHHWDPSQKYQNIFTGWAYPPKDYGKWGELVYQLALHCMERYGRKEVESWYWEVWNEPDIGYWQGTPEEYHKLYDYAADAVKRASPAIRIGGPTTTGPGSAKAAAFLRGFLDHVTSGKNHATGKTGSPLDYITFHAKGRPEVVSGHVRMGSEKQLNDIDTGFAIVASYPALKRVPIIIGESDPEGCAACSVAFNPQNAYRNGTMYSSYTAATFARKQQLAAKHGVNFEGAVTWAFEFENQPYFAGFRDLATNGIDKPVLNVFRMFGMLGGERLAVASSGAASLESMVKAGVKGPAPDIGAVATRDGGSISVLAWHYHDDDVTSPDATVTLEVAGFPAGVREALVRHYRVDPMHSNSYTAWKNMGSPQQPTAAQYAALEEAGSLQMFLTPRVTRVRDGKTVLMFNFPRQAVSLVRLSW